MCELSFIIPVYNTGKYISKCIDSILNQKINNYEIVIVDDGSTDNSLEVLQKYVGNEQIIIISQPNKGVSAARNKGIEVCNGDYIFFVDSDDYIESHSLNYILDILENKKPDLMRLSSAIIDNRKRKIEGTKLIGIKSIDKLYTNSIFFPALWGYIFKASIIKSHGILFNENLKYSEDSSFIFKYINYVDKIFFSNRIAYNYLIRNDSAIHQSFSLSWAEANLIALIDVLKFGCTKKYIKFIIDYYLRSYFIIIFKAKLILSVKAKKSYNVYFNCIYKYSYGNLTLLAKLSKKLYLLACLINSFIFYFYRLKSKYLS